MLSQTKKQRQAEQRRQATGGDMRLICPNCGAQYEVPDEVIPTSGRDVQCSDCGDTWYQYHPDFPPEPDHSEPEATGAAPEPEQEPDITAKPDVADDIPSATHASRYEDEEFYHEDEDEVPTASAEPTRRELDPEVRDVLREEAAREEMARQSDMTGGLETQQDLGLDEHDSEAVRRTQEARARMARLRGLPESADEPELETELDDIDPGSRRNLLPDIEEINSSLGPDRVREEQRRVEEPKEPKKPDEKTAFRSGFRVAIVLAVIALIVYVFAPKLVETVPALTGPLTGYVDLINSARLGLEQMVQNLAGSIGEGQ